MKERPIHPMGAAMQWVARIFAAALLMVVPGLAGQWLDERFKLGFVGLIGFAVGLISGMAYLIAVTRSTEAKRRRINGRRPEAEDRSGQD